MPGIDPITDADADRDRFPVANAHAQPITKPGTYTDTLAGADTLNSTVSVTQHLAFTFSDLHADDDPTANTAY